MLAAVIVLPGVGKVFPSEAPQTQTPKHESQPQVRTFELTAYNAQCPGCSGITYSGLNVRNTIYTPIGLRVVAVDPDVVALGSVVRIEFADGREIKAKASDIGGAIDGTELDLLVANRDHALELGRQTVKVEIISQ